jgi:hypothetical protein
MTYFSIVFIVVAFLAVGVVRERFRERKLRAWVAGHGGTLHWPFAVGEHPDLPAKELTLGFEPRGAHQWAVGIQHSVHDRAVWMIEYSSTPAGQSTSRWHCLVAVQCTDADEAQRICREKNEAASGHWCSSGDWVAMRHVGLISSPMLDQLSAHIG